MRRRLILIAAAVAAGAGFASLGAQSPGAGNVQALAALQPGQWLLKQRGGTAADRMICLGDTRQLIQVRHANNACVRHVIANGRDSATVHYKCAGAGHGQTIIRVETPRLVQISSQGIVGKEPFSISVEARRIGACPSGALAGGR